MTPKTPDPRSQRHSQRAVDAPLAALIVALLWPLPARAEVPVPNYPDCGVGGDLSACPAEAAGDWKLWSHTPAELEATLRPEEIELGIGNGVTEAWRTTTGRWDQIVVVADSGIIWRSTDLINKVFLNTGELPLPQFADGSAASSHDLDGNGLANTADYALDPRVLIDAGDDRADDLLDPSDLLATFSDGSDDDGNGYIDDIAGWDFFERDNDPGSTNESHYGDHGTGVARVAGAEAMNGGRVGVCPNCAILPVRIGDAFIATGDILADATAFAITHEAASMTLAVGGILTPSWLGEMFAHAWDEGLMIVAAAGDETSLHRNFPAVDPHALYVHTIGADSDDWQDATTFLRFVNCNNFGPRMDLVSASKNSCATGSVALIAGAAALVQSAAVDLLGERLSTDELFQVLTGTATDIDVPESRGEDADPDLFPSYPGWDQNFGYGRIDVGAAIAEVVAGAGRPTATIESPEWFSVFVRRFWDEDGTLHGSTQSVPVTGEITVAEGSSWDYRLEWGVGSDVAENAWTLVQAGSGAGSFSGELGRLEIGQSRDEDAGAGCASDEPPETSDPFADSGFDPAYSAPALVSNDGILGRVAKLDPYGITLRLQVTDSEGRTAAQRRHIYVREDPRMLSGFPMHLGASVESAPALADLDGDGIWEVIIASGDGTVHVIDGKGAALPGWPVQVGLHPSVDPSRADNHLDAPPFAAGLAADARQSVLAAVAVGALDGADARPDVVVATVDGELYAWRADGSLREGFPVTMNYANCDPALRDEDHRYDCGFGAAPTLVDLDGDGYLDILQPGMDQWLYLWDRNGEPHPGWPVKVQAPDFEAIANREGRILSSPAVGDIDGDGGLEIVLGTGQTAGSDFGGYGVLYALDGDGSLLPGWPITIFAGFAGALPVIGEGVVVGPALADVDGDGDLEIGANSIADQGALYHHDGTVAVDFAATRQSFGPYASTEEQAVLLMISPGSFADGNGDGVPDYFAGGTSLSYGANILAWSTLFDHDHSLIGYSGAADEDGRGQPLDGFPRQVEDLPMFASTAAADLDGDGISEVVFGSVLITRAWNGSGVEAEGFPMFHGGWLLGGPALGDIDGDGYRDMVLATREGYLFAWRTDGRADGVGEWLMMGHDAQRTGNYHVAVPGQVGPPPEPPEGACEVGGAVGGRGSLVMLLLALPWLVRRRRG
jgi:hypothetical protein